MSCNNCPFGKERITTIHKGYFAGVYHETAVSTEANRIEIPIGDKVIVASRSGRFMSDPEGECMLSRAVEEIKGSIRDKSKGMYRSYGYCASCGGTVSVELVEPGSILLKRNR